MSILKWQDEYSVGVAQIDEEHKALIGMINAAHAHANGLAGSKTVKVLIEEMQAYAANHFKTEEKLMEEYEFPLAERHIAAHVQFAEYVGNADKEFATEYFVPGTIKIVSFLAEWLKVHILETDKVLGEFLREKGVE